MKYYLINFQNLVLHCCVITCFFLHPLSCIAQSSVISVQNDRIERLERDIRALNIRLSQFSKTLANSPTSTLVDLNKPPPNSAVARLGVRIDRLEEDIQVTTGGMEDLNHQIMKIAKRLDKLVIDLDFRLTSLEARTRLEEQRSKLDFVTNSSNSKTGASSIQKNNGTLGTVSVSQIESIKMKKRDLSLLKPGSSKLENQLKTSNSNVKNQVSLSPELQYQQAFNLLQRADYIAAEMKLKEFIANNPNDILVENARYWLGETFYVRKIFEESAQIFFEGYQAKPKGAKAADSLLKLGMSLSRLGKKQDACAAFSKLTMDFKRAPERITKTLLRESKTNNCN